MSEKQAKKALKFTIPILIAVFSFFIVSEWLSASGYASYCTEAITESRNTVLKLTASSAAASAAITALPGDLATPIASELAELSTGFLIVMCALYLEKFMVAVAGTVVFKCLVPAACVIFLFGMLPQKEIYRSLAYKLVAVALAVLLLVPVSVFLSNTVEDTYEDSITQVIESAENSASQIQESVDGSKNPEEAGNGLGKIVQSLKNSGDLIANGTSQLIDYFEKLLSRFVESLAIMLVVSCVLPLLVIVFFVWILKMLFHFDAYANYKNLEKLVAKQRRNHGKDKEEQI